MRKQSKVETVLRPSATSACRLIVMEGIAKLSLGAGEGKSKLGSRLETRGG